MAVHPRERGEQLVAMSFHWPICGSSPRARGTAKPRIGAHLLVRFIPASAGNRYPLPPMVTTSPVHPRERGEQIKGNYTGR